jgi:hypothetical protein
MFRKYSVCPMQFLFVAERSMRMEIHAHTILYKVPIEFERNMLRRLKSAVVVNNEIVVEYEKVEPTEVIEQISQETQHQLHCFHHNQ